MTYQPEQLEAMSKLYDEVLDSKVTDHAIEFLCRAQLLLDITGDDLETARGFIHTDAGREAVRREWDDMDDDGRKDITEIVSQHWSLNVNLAVRKLWHAANVLGFQPTTLDPKHVAMTAATYLSRHPTDILNEMTTRSEATDS
jgi:hypothetical protein